MISIVPDLEKTKIIEVYVYHDRPLLFCCEDVVHQKYIAVLADEDDESEAWLYAAISQRRFEMIRSGGIDLHTAFSMPETGYLYTLVINHESGELNLKITPNSEVNPLWLPKPDFKLELQTDTLPQKSENQAINSLRERIRLKLNFANYTRSEAPSLTLGQVLVHFQKALNDIFDGSWMRVVGVVPGSFGIELESEELPNLFRESKTGLAIKVLVDFLRSAENELELTERLKGLNPDAVKSIADLAKSLSGIVTSTEIKWDSPNPEDGGAVKLSSSSALSIFSYLSHKPEPKKQSITIRGTLRGLDLKTRHYRITTEAGSEYSGYVLQEFIIDPVIQNAQISQNYIAVIEEWRYVQLNEPDPKPQYFLIKLDHLPPE